MSCAILAPKTSMLIVSMILYGEVTVHKSIDTLAEGSSKLIPTEYVNSLTIGGMPPHHL